MTASARRSATVPGAAAGARPAPQDEVRGHDGRLRRGHRLRRQQARPPVPCRSGPDYQPQLVHVRADRRARNSWLLGYFDRFDQTRGISPLASALNSFRDTYEGFDLALAQSKVAQLFALAIKRNSIKAVEDLEEQEGPAKYRDEIDFNRGPVLLELDPGDVAEFLQSNNPSSNWQAFMNLVIAASLKALDIPFSLLRRKATRTTLAAAGGLADVRPVGRGQAQRPPRMAR